MAGYIASVVVISTAFFIITGRACFGPDESMTVDDNGASPSSQVEDEPVRADEVAEMERRVAENDALIKKLQESQLIEMGEVDANEAKNCEAVTCNFEGRTLCSYVAVGVPATEDHDPNAVSTGIDIASILGPGGIFGADGLSGLFGQAQGGGGLFGDNGVGGLLGTANALGQQAALAQAKAQAMQAAQEAAQLPSMPSQATGPHSSVASFFEKGRRRRRRQDDGGSSGGVLGAAFKGDTAMVGFTDGMGDIDSFAEGTAAAGGYVFPKETARMFAVVNFTSEQTVTFYAYEATKDVELKACCDSPDYCPFRTEVDNDQKKFKKWKAASVTCPANTRAVMFVCDNLSGVDGEEGACGIDDVQLEGVQCTQKYTDPDAAAKAAQAANAAIGILGGGSTESPTFSSGLLGRRKRRRRNVMRRGRFQWTFS